MEDWGEDLRRWLGDSSFHARYAALGRQDPARRAYTDDDDIGLFRCHGFMLSLLPLSVPFSFWRQTHRSAVSVDNPAVGRYAPFRSRAFRLLDHSSLY